MLVANKAEYLKNKYVLIGTTLLLAGVFLFIGFLLGKNWENSTGTDNEESKEIRQSGYSFINPLLECELGSNTSILKSDELRIKKIIQKEIIEKNPKTSIAVYYRDLNNGPWFGINEQTVFSPASLLKVPIMIAYYKYAEHNPEVFTKKILFEKTSSNLSQQIRPEKQLEPGKSYTVAQLLEAMIRYSDNEATTILFQNMDPKDFSSVFADLGIAMPEMFNTENSMPLRDYASFFRILYNSSYLNRDMSEQALGLLSTVEYAGGLSGGIPKDIILSHKFGERESLSKDKKVIRQLHDCGIIYHPKRPYLLCVMTKGDDFSNLSKIISEISRRIYTQIDEATR